MESVLSDTWVLVITVAAVIISLWSLPWKAVALWKAARNKDKLWFIILFLFNTMALLEIFYIFVFSKKKENLHANPEHTNQ